MSGLLLRTGPSAAPRFARSGRDDGLYKLSCSKGGNVADPNSKTRRPRLIARPRLACRVSRCRAQRPRAAAAARRCPAGVLPLVRRRHGVHRRLHGPGRCQYDADPPAGARARFRRAPQQRELDRGRLHPGDGVVHADLRPAGRHVRPQAALHQRLSGVRSRLGTVRLRAQPSRADRLPHPAGDRRGIAHGQQRGHCRPRHQPR